MKKKIKDLTLEECEKVCRSQRYCHLCPLRHKQPEDINLLDCPVGYEIDYWLREVEVDE